MAAVELHDVNKRYRVYSTRNRSLKDILIQRRIGEWEDRWALRGVSFSIDHGGSLGLVGPNGAGKSTALKLVARILEPDGGTIRTEGRVGSLIELGAGFHPESTGRENVLLNASLLGVREADIRRRFADIVEFAGLGEVIDQPLRTYSSGMQVRLGFSVAVHTEPEILLLDEILAVGDEAFQLRCFDFIRSFKRDGGTLLFVSHSMDAVREVCATAAWIEHGDLRALGPSGDVVGEYVESVHRAWEEVPEGPVPAEAPAVALGLVRLVDGDGRAGTTFDTGSEVCVEIPYRRLRELPDPVFGVAVHNAAGVYVYGTNTRVDRARVPPLAPAGVVVFRLPALSLLPGSYVLSAGVFAGDGLVPIDFHERRYPFRVRGAGDEHGVVRLAHDWSFSGRS